MFSLCYDTTARHYIIKAYPQLMALLLFSSTPLALPLPCSIHSNSSLISYIADIPPQFITLKLQFVLVKLQLPGSCWVCDKEAVALFHYQQMQHHTSICVFCVCFSIKFQGLVCKMGRPAVLWLNACVTTAFLLFIHCIQ